MAIPENMMEAFCFLDKKHIPDGEGGQLVEWIDGADFKGTAVIDSTLETIVAAAIKGKIVYTLYTPASVAFEFGDVVKRKKDGQTFRITAVGNAPPNESTINLRQNQAEAWELTK